ncbi:hypothetical protein BC6307_21035 [Sutcliffiella cohnii]|uniref:Major facilitator superfamily (MFS) profile domain-containing protein n=1 Tax=Sutcliffiella cohnii TaxID=33932 RepID=A0A223KW26_9BACI|nr:MFS transporter [Sutcliffiella cohnii]AST93573.1 hypothetical protein BC6307_21035 [Sutcliffiella cohnii]
MNFLTNRSILKDSNFFLFWLSHVISSMGNTLIPVTITFAVLEVTGSATKLGVVLGALWISRVLFVMFGGVLADRLSRKKILIISDLLQGVNHLIIGILFFVGSIEMWHLIVSSVLYGAVSAFHSPASSGIIPQLTSKENYQKANSVLSIMSNIFEIAGPALAGLMVVFLGFSTIFFIDALTFFLSLILMLFVKERFKKESQAQESYWTDLVEGIKVTRNYSWIWSTLIIFSVLNFATAAFYVLGPIVISENYGGPKVWGFIVTAGAIGGLIGALLSHNIKLKNPLRFCFIIMPLFVSIEFLVLIGPMPSWLIMFAAMLASASIVIGAVLWDTIVQKNIPQNLLSRIGSLDSFVSFVFMPLGFVLAGPLSDQLGMTMTLIIITSFVVVSSILILFVGDTLKIKSGKKYNLEF